MEWTKPEATSGEGREFFKASAHDGALLGFTVKRYEPTYKNNFDEVKETVFADVKVFDGPNAGKVYENAELAWTAFVSALKGKVGQNVLARVEKPAGKRYWALADPTEKDFAIAAGVDVDAKEAELAAAAGAKKPVPF